MSMSLQSSGSIQDLISFPDVLVFFTCIGATVASIFYGNSLKGKANSAHAKVIEHLLMGRTLTLPMFVATLVATWYGGIFGVTEIAFNHGVYNFLTQGVFWYATYLVFAFFLVDKIAGYKAVTLPELAGKMFGPAAGKVAAVFNFFNVLPVAYSLSLGLFIQMLTGWALFPSVAFGTALVCTYSILGGFRADVFSDIVQFGIMCTSVFLVVVFAYFKLGDFYYLKEHLPATHFKPLGGHSIATTLVWGFIAFATLVDPNFYQKCFAVEKPHIARRGIIISTIIWFLFDICTTLGGMYARAALADADPKQSYLLLALQILPNGLRGFFLAGIVAIIISTLDSFLIIASHSLSYDLVPEKWRHKVILHRLSTILVGVIAVTLSMVFEGSIKNVWKILGSYSAGCLLLPMLLGFFRPGFVSEIGFIVATLLGAFGITIWRLSERSGFWQEVDELYIGFLMTFLGIILVKIISSMITPRTRKLRNV